jgi:hypothetical protein
MTPELTHDTEAENQADSQALTQTPSDVPNTDLTVAEETKPERIRKILQLHAAGFNQVQIARVMGCHDATISRTLRDWLGTDTRDVVPKLHKAKALDVAYLRLQKIRNYDQATDWLEREGLVQPKQQQAGSSITIVIGDGQAAIGPAPTFASEPRTIDALSVPHIPVTASNKEAKG